VIVTGFGIALVCMNYHFLKIVKKDASFEQLLIGDLLTNKIVKSIKKQSITLATKEDISQTTSKYEESLQVISLDQLKKPVANLTIEVPELSSIKPLALSMKAEPLFIGEKYKIGTTAMRDTSTGIRGLGFTRKCESMVRECPDRNDFIFSSHFHLVREMSNVVLKIHKTQSSLFEGPIGKISVVYLNEPLKEGRIPID
jgi:hypothetical protein